MADALLSGVLPAVYSTSNVMKRKLIDALRNPMGTLENVAGTAYDKAMNARQMLTASADESVRGPATDRMLNAMADGYNPAGITVWHGSPHKFAKFDSSKMGTGEGAQSYGDGTYLAEAPAVAKGYKEALSEPEITLRGRTVKTQSGTPMDTAKAWLQDVYDRGFFNSKTADPFQQAMADVSAAPVPGKDGVIAALKKLQNRGASMEKGGNLYKVDLPDDQVAKMLNWDEPFNKQSSAVKQALQKIGVVVDEKKLGEFDDALLAALDGTGSASLPKQPLNLTGESIYRKLGSSAAAAKALREAGVPGIRYLDGNSRGAGGTSNFVVFPGNEDMLKILEVNGQPVIDALRRKP